MALTEQQIKEEAKRLDAAEIQRRQIEATTVRYPHMTMDDAYEIQDCWVSQKLQRGRRVIGHKIGLTSRTMQKAMNIDEPDFGILLDDMLFDNEGTIRVGDFLDPRVEVELAFILKKDLKGEDLTIEDVLDASEKILPAIELIAARSFRSHPDTGYIRTIRDTISDNAANAGIILGSRSIDPSENDLRWIGSLLSKNGIIEETGLAAGVLDHPANGVIWLARKYADYGRILERGQIILAGSFTKPIIVNPGDKIVADFGHFGNISCQFI